MIKLSEKYRRPVKQILKGERAIYKLYALDGVISCVINNKYKTESAWKAHYQDFKILRKIQNFIKKEEECPLKKIQEISDVITKFIHEKG